MSLPLVFHPDVQGEMDEAYRWYEQQQAGLGDDFLAAIEEVFARLRQTPQAHQVIYRGVRRALPRRFLTASTTGFRPIALRCSLFSTVAAIPGTGSPESDIGAMTSASSPRRT